MDAGNKCRLAGLAAGLALLGANAFGQVPTASLTGLVRDPSGAVVPGAQLRIVDNATRTGRSASTNNDGYYSFQLIPPGDYRLTIQKTGFQTLVQANVQLNVQQSARMDFTLPLGTSRQEVTVASAAPLLQNDTSSISQLVSSKQIADLPLLGRNAYALVQLVPGAFVPASYNNLPVDFISQTYVSINGARANQNAYLLDGIGNVNTLTLGPAVYPDVDAVQEYRVTTNNYGAEYGQAAGGVFNVASKSGPNRFHGDAYDCFRNDGLDANDFFSDRAGLAKAPFRFNQFGATAGGPIRKNKTFFFEAYEGVREIQGVTFVDTVPTSAQRQGDFSRTFNSGGKLIQIFDPFSTAPDPGHPGQFIRTPFAGNPVTNTNNFTSATPQGIHKDDFSVRVDQYISDKQR
ncbi:MAG: carboxypeptidase regulatory-like domain-containing protein, partial [Bryobacteraceae bacterium]